MSKGVILLVCTIGMSSNLIVANMQRLSERKGLDLDVYAVSAPELEAFLAKREVKVLLLGPQVRYLEKELCHRLKEVKIPIGVISMKDYGNLESENILAQAIELLR